MNDLTIRYYFGKMTLYLETFLPANKATIKKIFKIIAQSEDAETTFYLFIANAGYEIDIKRMYSASKAKKVQENIEYMNHLYFELYGKNIRSYDELYLKYYGGDKK